jgi:peptidoglycan hydrolase-like protein with peptidoglycan-binding domain
MFSDHRFPSIEGPHNSIHGIVSGIMSSFQSAFHPVFWLHHCNVDRIYEKYLALEPDSASEFQKHQAKQDPRPAQGFPEGPWGPYAPFTHHKTGKPFHARDCFDAAALGFAYNELPPVQPPQMREPPFFAVFRGVDIRKLEHPRLLYVFVASKSTDWTAPDAESEITEAPGFAGMASVFFFDQPGGCANCKINPIIDVFIDITQALRDAKLRPSKAALHVLVEDSQGNCELLANTPVPEPQLKGPRFGMMTEMLAQGVSPGHEAEDDAKELQALLLKHGAADAETVGGDISAPDGIFGPLTEAAVKKLQKAAGLLEDGIAGPKTKAKLLASGLHDDFRGDRLQTAPGSTVTWSLDLDSVPTQLKKDKLVEELQAAFAPWGEAVGLTFEQVAPGVTGAIAISFADTISDETAFDGPGGALANATASSICFDCNERWELQGHKHPQRDFMDWDEMYFGVLPVALHEIGHVLGLSHSFEEKDVMSPYYQGYTQLSDNDIRRVKEIFGVAA